MQSYKELSKHIWEPTEKGWPGFEPLSFGCLQRIADATELMARRYNELLIENEKYRRSYSEAVNQMRWLRRRIAGFQGYLTRLKKRSLRS